MKDEIKDILIIFLLSAITLIFDRTIYAYIIKIIIYTIVLALCKKENMIKYFVIFNCLSNSILLYCTNCLFGAIYLVRKRTIIKSKIFTVFLLLGLYELLHGILVISNNLNIDSFLKQLLAFLTFSIFGMIMNDSNIKDKNKIWEIVNAYIVSMIFLGGILLIKKIDYYGINNLLNLKNGIGTTTIDLQIPFSFSVNSNSISRKLGLAVSFLVANICINRKINLTLLIKLILTVILGFLTYTLSFLLFFVALIIFILFYEFFRKNKSKKTILKFSLVIIVMALLLIMIKNTTFFTGLIQNYKRSLTSDDISTGRLDIYAYYINILLNDFVTLIFGKGLKTYQTIYAYAAAHNVLLEILLSWGLIGLGIVIYLILLIIKKNKGKNICYYLPIFCLLLYFLTCNFFIGYFSNLILLLEIYIFSYYDGEGD